MEFTRKVIYCKNKKNQKIYGEAFIPNSQGPFPLIIFSHGYGYNISFIEPEKLSSNGISVYQFDFCGGCPFSKSDGKSTEMSVMTEAEDLECVLDEMKNQSFVDKNRIYLSGGSQGGFVSIIVGERRQNELKGLILYCPALVIKDFEKNYLKEKEIPKTFRFDNMMLSRIYVDDVRNYDVYNAIKNIKIPFLYYHGDKDELVNIEYAYKAQKYFNNNGKLIILKNTYHMLNYGNENKLFLDIINFILKNKF